MVMPCRISAFKGAAQSLGRRNAAFPAGSGEIFHISYSQELLQPDDGVGSQSWNCLQSKKAGWKLSAHPLKPLINVTAMQCLDAFGDSGADAGNFLKRSGAHQLVQRLHETAQTGCGPHVGLGFIRIAILEAGALADFF